MMLFLSFLGEHRLPERAAATAGDARRRANAVEDVRGLSSECYYAMLLHVLVIMRLDQSLRLLVPAQSSFSI